MGRLGRQIVRFCFLGLVVLVAAALARADEPPRYWAMLADGTPLTGPAADRNWWDDGAKLGGRRLFDAANPVRVWADLTLKPGLPETYVLLANGDVLPGRASEYQPAAADAGLPARLLVVPDQPVQTPELAGIWVRADRVVRIVVAKGDAAAREPGTLVFADGRTLTANVIRWAPHGVRVLTDTGTATATFDELRDLHLPKVDRLAAVGDDGAYPPLATSRQIARLQTVEGAAITWRREMTFVSIRALRRQTKKGPEPEPFLHLQPAWSLSPIVVPVGSVCEVGFRGVDEVPLSLLPAEVLSQPPGIHAWPWQRNRNVLGETLRSGRVTADVGIGTHAAIDLAFELPAEAVEFNALVGLDAAVDAGACAAAKVFFDQPKGKPAFASGLLRGGQEPVRVGPLALGKARRLVLVSDCAHQGRPADAYPFDIGDHVDWLLPTIRLSQPPGDRAELVRRFLPGAESWTIADDDARRLQCGAAWEESLDRWLAQVRFVQSGTIALRHTATLAACANDVLELILSPMDKAVVERVELLVDGERQEPADRYRIVNLWRERVKKHRHDWGKPPSGDVNAVVLRWDLQAFDGREVKLELRIAGDEKAVPLVWHRLQLRGVVAGLTAGGPLPKPDVSLTSLTPLNVVASRSTDKPTIGRLPSSSKHGPPITLLGRRFDDGYGLVGKTTLTFAVDPSYGQFVGLVGSCSERVGPLEILLDDEPVWDSGEIDDSMPAVPVRIDIPPGTEKLTLRLTDVSPGHTPAACVDAGFMKRKTEKPAEPQGPATP